MNKPESGNKITAIPSPPITLPRKHRKIRTLTMVSTTDQLKYDISHAPRKRPAALRMKNIVREYFLTELFFFDSDSSSRI